MNKLWNISDIHNNYIFDILKKMNKENEKEVLSEIYQYIKSITSFYYDGSNMHEAYNTIRFSLSLVEEKVHSKILNVPVDFNIIDNINKDDNFIEYIIHNVRKYLIELNRLDLNRIKFENINFTNNCYEAAYYIKKNCDINGIDSYILQITPGYDKTAYLYGNDGLGFHYCNVIKIFNKYYLIDVTYSQFFYTNHNNLERIGLVNVQPCQAGSFMLMSEKGQNIAKQIIKKGYIELNEEILKMYLDAFTVSFRNGLYYEHSNDFSFTTDYTIDDYIKFFKGYDSQINNEGKENLGYQRKPLKNYKMIIKRNYN